MEHNTNLYLQNKSLLFWLNEDYSARGGMRWYFYSSQKLVWKITTCRYNAYGRDNPEKEILMWDQFWSSHILCTSKMFMSKFLNEYLHIHHLIPVEVFFLQFFFWEEKETLFLQGNECRINVMETNLFCSFWDMLPGEVSFLVRLNLHGLGLVQRVDKQQMQWQKCHSLIHYFVVELKEGQVTLICPLAYHTGCHKV